MQYTVDPTATTMKPTARVMRRWGKADVVGPDVTICIPVHNGSKTISETLDSTLDLNLATSVIVVDDGSRDDTLQVVSDWADAHEHRLAELTVLALPHNWGLATARNTGIQAADSQFYIPLDADNLLNGRAVAPMLEFAKRNAADAAYGPLKRFGSDRGLMGTYPWSLERLSHGNYIDALALISKSLWSRVGGYSSLSVQGLEDYDFWLKSAEVGATVLYAPYILGYYRVEPHSMIHSMNSDLARLAREELLFRHPGLLRTWD